MSRKLILILTLAAIGVAHVIQSTTDITPRDDILDSILGIPDHLITDDVSPDDEDEANIDADALHYCDWTLQFDSLDAIQDDSDNLNTPCIAIYTLQVLADMLESAYNNYTSVNDGYDEEFGYYVTYMKNLIPGALSDQLMFNISATGPDDQFAVLGDGMNYFDCELSSSPGNKFPCSDLGQHSTGLWQYETTLWMRDRGGYSSALDKVGIPQDWTDFGDFTLQRTVSQPRATRTWPYQFHDFPIENSSLVIPNPKDIVTKGLGDIGQLQADLDDTIQDAMMLEYVGGSLQDAVQAYSVPVFMLMQAVDSMAQAKVLGKQEEDTEAEAERKRKENLILLIISVVLMFIPVVGEELASVTGIAALGRAIAIVAEVGNGALAVYDTVQDPKSALLNVLGMLFGVGVIAKAPRDGEGLGRIAAMRRGIKPEVIAGLGSIFKTQDDKIQRLMSVCKIPS